MDIVIKKEEDHPDVVYNIIKEEQNLQDDQKHEFQTKSEPIPGTSQDTPSERTIKHETKENRKNIFKCPECAKEFLSRSGVARHRRMVHKVESGDGKEVTFNCQQCPRRFGSEVYLMQHLKKHTPRDPNDLKCDICGKICNSRGYLGKHRLTHSGKRFECKECGEKYASNQYLRLHTMKVHFGLSDFDITGKILECRECGKKCSSKPKLELHMDTHRSVRLHKRTDKSGKDQKCTICSKILKESAMKDHMMSVHSDERNFICNICGDAFKLKSTLTKHKIRHEDTKQKSCKICGKKVRRDYMRWHMKVMHSGQEYECEKCGMKFRMKKYIRSHILHTHLGIPKKSGKEFNCEKCGKGNFRSNYCYKIHFLNHNTTRDYKCSVCPKAFRSEHDCKYHEKKAHSGLFQCSMCTKEFRKEAPLFKHLEMHKRRTERKCKICKKVFLKSLHLRRHLDQRICEKTNVTQKITNNQSESRLDQSDALLNKCLEIKQEAVESVNEGEVKLTCTGLEALD